MTFTYVDAGNKAVAELWHDRAMFVQTDVSSDESVRQSVAAVMARFGAVHVCINGAAYEGQVGQCAYSATKAAIIGMNMPVARELGAVGVRVNAIAPGLFLTAMVAGLDEKVLNSLKEQMEAPKRLGDLREFAHCCAFIIENAYVNAETIRLDGAARMRAH